MFMFLLSEKGGDEPPCFCFGGRKEGQMEIVYKKIGELKPYENNPRKNDEAVDAVAASISEFGWKVPVVIDTNNVIVAGHTRYKAAKKLGIEDIPCIVADDLTEEQVRAYRLADNKTNELAEWDFQLLEQELDGLEMDMEQFGFEMPDFTIENEVVEDEPPEPPEEPKAKLGDIYQLGRHRLMCGDSTDPAVIDRLMDGVKAKLLLTDPPYGIDYGGMLKGKGDGKGGADKNGWKSYDAPTWDIERPDESVFSYIITLAEESIIWGGNYFADILPPKMCWLVWDKGQRDFSLADGELAWTSFDKALRIKTYSRASANREEKVHPTQKPIELLRWCIEDIAERNMESVDTILDLFGGSGSTLIACEQLGRKCFMMELDPHYVDVIIERWENLTGEKAVKLNV